ncbi:MAG: ParB/RepB/Spo0J family partition protein [Acidobacteria bacterium]|nr:ParB/RepB/Spo0J family partition protein [Acidobacteriota bacterium]
MSKRGLPNTLRMRHDEHYVEALAASAGTPVGRIVPIDLLDPNPDQPRQVMGDLSELIASVTEKGIIEPLIVRQRGGRFQIIAGERRYHAAVQAGLREVPVVERAASDAEVLELALIENLQRKDLTAFEEAEAMQQLAERCRYTHEDMARKLGKSRTSITESLALNNMPEEVRNLCRLADISSRSTLLQIVRQATPEKMLALVEKMVTQGAVTRQDARSQTAKSKAARPRPFVFSFRAPTKSFRLRLSFAKSRVDRSEIIEALENIIRDIKAGR